MTDQEQKRSRRWILILVVGLALLAALATSWVWWNAEPEPLEAAGTDLALEQRVPDLRVEVDLSPPDSGTLPDRRRRPRPTRVIEPREQRLLLRRYGAALRVCYHRVARRAPSTVAGRADVTVNLADWGRVRSVKVSAGGDRQLEGCVRRAVQGWRFSSTLKAQQIRFPVIFR